MMEVKRRILLIGSKEEEEVVGDNNFKGLQKLVDVLRALVCIVI